MHVNAGSAPAMRNEPAMSGGNVMRHLLATIAVLLLVSAGAARAGDPNAAKGIIVNYCIKCHTVPRYNPIEGLPTVNAPDLGMVANNPEKYPLDRLRGWLRRPHYPMAGFILSPSDIENIIAFIESLRTE